MEWTAVVDISKHQGDVDFAKMRSAGVEGVIIRATHGSSVDTKLTENVAGARLAEAAIRMPILVSTRSSIPRGVRAPKRRPPWSR